MDLSPGRIDALTEIINVGVGRAAASLNEMLESHVRLQVPDVRVISQQEIDAIDSFVKEDVSAVKLDFEGFLSGMSSLVFSMESASKLVAILTGEELGSPDLDPLKTETLNEVGNIVLNCVMGSVGNMLEKNLFYSLPSYMEDTVSNLIRQNIETSGAIVIARAIFNVERHDIEGNIILVFELSSFDSLLSAIDAC